MAISFRDERIIGLVLFMHEYDDGMNKSIDLGGVSYGFVFFWVVDEMTIIYDGSTSTELVRRATYKSR